MTKAIDKFQKKLNEISKIGTSNAFLRKVGARLEADIRFRARAGFGNDTPGGQATPFTVLNRKTIVKRRRKKLHPKTTPSKSNLTESGQMLDSLQNRVSGGKLEISFKNTQRANEEITNGALANLHEKGTKNLPARPFINPTDRELDNITRQLVSEVLKKFKQ